MRLVRGNTSLLVGVALGLLLGLALARIPALVNPYELRAVEGVLDYEPEQLPDSVCLTNPDTFGRYCVRLGLSSEARLPPSGTQVEVGELTGPRDDGPWPVWVYVRPKE